VGKEELEERIVGMHSVCLCVCVCGSTCEWHCMRDCWFGPREECINNTSCVWSPVVRICCSPCLRGINASYLGSGYFKTRTLSVSEL